MAAERITEQMNKFSHNKEEGDISLIKDEDDDKQDLDKDVIFKGINMIGGKAFWVVMLISYLIQSLWGKYTDYKLKNLSTSTKEEEGVQDIAV